MPNINTSQLQPATAQSSPDSTPEKPKQHIRIPYTPREQQLLVHQDPTRFKVIVAHRRFGKTTLAINHLIKFAIEKPGRYWYVAPTYRQAKTIAFDLMQRFLPSQLVKKKNENELTFRLINGSEIALKGSENEDSLRGVGLHGLVLDEYEMMDRKVWEAVLQPTLNDYKGWAIFLGTPLGRNHFFELYNRNLPDWRSYHFSAEDTGIYSKLMIDRARTELPEETFRQEYLAEFLDGEGTVFRHLREVTREKEQCFEDPQFSKSYQIGADLARLQDFSVFMIIDQNMKVVYFERFQKLVWEYQKLKLIALSERYNHARIVLDATGVGDPLANDLTRMGMNVMPYKISSSQSKKELIENLKLRIEQKQVIIPNEPILLKELEAYTYKMTDSGRIIFTAPSGYHDDCVISLALAVWNLQPIYGHQRSDQFADYDDEY